MDHLKKDSWVVLDSASDLRKALVRGVIGAHVSIAHDMALRLIGDPMAMLWAWIARGHFANRRNAPR